MIHFRTSLFRNSIALFALTATIPSSFAAPQIPQERKLYVGKESTEAKMTFSHSVEMVRESKPTLTQAREQIESQIVHLFGPMGFATVKAVPKGDHKITQVKVSAKAGARGTYLASYTYQGTIVLQDGPRAKYTVTLPINPEKIYAAGAVKEGRTETYPCTDEHYPSEGDFWYFWNPDQAGCPLEKDVDYQLVETKVERMENTRSTYPEYERLVNAEGAIKISLLMGMDDPSKGKDPNASADINAENFREIKQTLIGMGFENRKLKATEIKAVYPGRQASPYVERFTKIDAKATLVVEIFFGPSGIDEKSAPFHHFFKEALENSSIMMYDGHSGLGGHLDLASIEDAEGFRIQPSKSRYQIYFFNSCTSYTYYNTMFFGRKTTQADPKGSKNLDIMTNGLATYFSVMHDTNLALVRAIDAWANGKGRISYQKLADEIDSDNLFGIIGDEDNRAQ